MIQKNILFYIILKYIILINIIINCQDIDTIIYNAQNNDKDIKITISNGNYHPICFSQENNDANVRKCIGCHFSTPIGYIGIYNIISTCTFTWNGIFENIRGNDILLVLIFIFMIKIKNNTEFDMNLQLDVIP